MSVRINLEIGHEASLRTKRTPEGFTHDWEVFVRGCEGADIHNYIEKVVFHLHETFPKPKRVIKEPPYSVKESGYAGFNFPIDIYVKNKDEPKKIKFNYDLHLQQAGPAIIKVQKEKYVFHNPPEDFKHRLLKGGGMVVSSSSSLDISENKSNSEEKPQLLNKPKLGGSDMSKKHKIKVDEMRGGSQSFRDIFGPPIAKTAKPTIPEPPKSIPKDVIKIKEPSKDKGSDKEKIKNKSPMKDKEKDRERSKEKSGDKNKEKNKDKDRNKERDRSKEKSSSKRDKSPRPRSQSPKRSPKRANSPKIRPASPKRPQSPKRPPSPKHKEKEDKQRAESKIKEEKKSKEERKKEKRDKEREKDVETKYKEKEASKNDAYKDYNNKIKDVIKPKDLLTRETTQSPILQKVEKKERTVESIKEEKKEKHKHKKKDKDKEKRDKKEHKSEKKSEKNNGKHDNIKESLFASPKHEPTKAKPLNALFSEIENENSSSSHSSKEDAIVEEKVVEVKKIDALFEPKKIAVDKPEKIKPKKDKTKKKDKKAEKEEKKRKRKSDTKIDDLLLEPEIKLPKEEHFADQDTTNQSQSSKEVDKENQENPEEYMKILRELQQKIMSMQDNSELQKVVQLIAETGRYEVSARTFDFDLCLLERSTVRRLQEFFAIAS